MMQLHSKHITSLLLIIIVVAIRDTVVFHDQNDTAIYSLTSRTAATTTSGHTQESTSSSSSSSSPPEVSIPSIPPGFNIDCQKLDIPESEHNFVKTKTTPSFYMDTHKTTDAVSGYIAKDGCFECFHLQQIQNQLSRYQHNHPYFVDIGGNIGMWTLSLLASHPTVEAYTFEPSRKNYRKICGTITRMYEDDKEGDSSISFPNIYDRIHLYNIAATVVPETFNLVEPTDNKGGTHLTGATKDQAGAVRNDGTFLEDVIHGYPLDMMNLPIMDKDGKHRAVLLKIDVEGHELLALLGALHFLQDANIVFAAMELRHQSILEDLNAWKKIFYVLSYYHDLVPYRVDYGMEGDVLVDFLTKLDVDKLGEWKHFKHPHVTYFDVMWMKESEEEDGLDKA